MAPIFKIATFLSLSLYVAAQGTQFITGACKSDAECASGCCSFVAGKCAAPFVANERGEGCGFGDAQPNNNALQVSKGATGNMNANAQPAAPSAPLAPAQSQPAAPAQPSTPAPAAGNGAAQGAGKQFITGACTSDADCAAGCCGFKSGKCAGPVVAQERDGGCGFGDAQPNDNAAKALQARSLGRKGPALM